MEILTFPNPALLAPCQPVTVFGPELLVLLDNMYATMLTAKGIGLAANQVGLTFRMFVMKSPDGAPIYLVNPEIVSKSDNLSSFKEGCLSAPGEIVFNGTRASWVTVKYNDAAGQEQALTFSGIHAVCVQHEVEHLDGKSFLLTSKLSKSKRRELAVRWGLKLK